MNKLTKYRVWCPDLKKFVFDPKQDLGQYLGISINGYGHIHHMNEYKPKWIVQYFTGLRDKKGVDVYEGDILLEDHDGGTGEAYLLPVTYSSGSFHFGFCDSLYNHVYSTSPDILDSHTVMGNIFENPELLNNEKNISKL
jgi:hypothetical protein